MPTLSIPSDTKNLSFLESFLADAVKDEKVDETCFHNAIVVFTEAVNNAINHGNKRDPSKNVSIEALIEEDLLVLKIRDQGTGFDVDSLPDPLHPENLLREGGRGVFLIRAFSESVDFQDTGSGTLAVIRLRLRAK